ncbi:MAG: tRNA (adenosine(37)-N6)-threonylcarbamoyltransferase complex ATPase subunit type 1 TsaE [Planctomycetaceae bacterium]|jgi:tRNA threonylcarbamoyladenosine biosynthesis protein TsaE|nr:tRNA (adenosine(37)-N6)-threonylcarbamoyltransferase complex ATPase subunit type 1 TsaE [Planctomycetaceae bacterium]
MDVDKTLTASFTATDEDGTFRLGHVLAETLPDGLVCSLVGTLGAGKTRLVQAIAVASGVERESVSSPTFVLLHEYTDGNRNIYHFDAYRLKNATEFQQLGAEEYFDAGGLTFIEWADRVTEAIPAENLEIKITPVGETTRRFDFVASNGNLKNVIDAVRKI